MIDFVLPVVDGEGIAEVVEVVFPDFHRLLNAPWPKIGETRVTEEAAGWDKKFNPLVFFLVCKVSESRLLCVRVWLHQGLAPH
jgi:hypothetical protein